MPARPFECRCSSSRSSKAWFIFAYVFLNLTLVKPPMQIKFQKAFGKRKTVPEKNGWPPWWPGAREQKPGFPLSSPKDKKAHMPKGETKTKRAYLSKIQKNMRKGFLEAAPGRDGHGPPGETWGAGKGTNRER